MLVCFRGHCRFSIYMPNKPSKYGIKNKLIYTGKECDGKLLPKRKLFKTHTSCFTSTFLRNYARLKKSKKDLSATFLPNRNRQKGFTEHITLLFHVPKKGKPEIIVFHNDINQVLILSITSLQIIQQTNEQIDSPIALFYVILKIA
ncbi:hypothetical protein PR048_011077 [Dryococelus australis]|uniref:Uncharacterized protein n=1 Tax=Dryococelus australis TaxID=614101 RepID=A0ABQ9HKJ5_9NEOP|nr:hypothetical protein PR048_011077 [Dryococelus australis]